MNKFLQNAYINAYKTILLEDTTSLATISNNVTSSNIQSNISGTNNSEKNILYNNQIIAIVPGSFKPPHKGHWEMIMEYCKLAKDKVIVIVSNVSKQAISKRPLSKTNLTRFAGILNDIETNTSIDISDIKNKLDDEINYLTYNDLKEFLQNINNELTEYPKIQEKISKYLKSLDNTLFKSIRLTSAGTDIDAETAVEIFKIYAAAYNLTNQTEFKVAVSPSPIGDMSYMIQHNCDNCDIYLGVSQKGGDDDRFASLIPDLYEKMTENEVTNNLIEYPVIVQTMMSSTDIRNNITDLKREWFPDKISDTDFEKIKELLNGK